MLRNMHAAIFSTVFIRNLAYHTLAISSLDPTTQSLSLKIASWSYAVMAGSAARIM